MCKSKIICFNCNTSFINTKYSFYAGFKGTKEAKVIIKCYGKYNLSKMYKNTYMIGLFQNEHYSLHNCN